MTKKQKSKKKKKVSSKDAFSSLHRGRKARKPVSFSPSAKGSASVKRGSKRRSKTVKAERSAGKKSSSNVLRFPRLRKKQELRDIAELTFGKRKVAATHPPLEALGLTGAVKPQRVRVDGTEITETPWRKICDLLITANDGTQHTGTAWFISPRTLVTAGHCIAVFSPGTAAHGMVRSILVMPSRNGETDSSESPFGWVEVERDDLRVHPNWLNNGQLDFDYGAIILPEDSPLGSQTGFFGFGHFNDQDLDESAPTLSGYPDDEPEGTQWFGVNLIKELTATRVFYNIFTFDGQSGSPVFFRNNNSEIACAIHNFGDVPFNSGVRINPDVIDQLNEWKVS